MFVWPPSEVFTLALSNQIWRLTIRIRTEISPTERTFVLAGCAWLRACRIAATAVLGDC
jgi:hypothetical protein